MRNYCNCIKAREVWPDGSLSENWMFKDALKSAGLKINTDYEIYEEPNIHNSCFYNFENISLQPPTKKIRTNPDDSTELHQVQQVRYNKGNNCTTDVNIENNAIYNPRCRGDCRKSLKSFNWIFKSKIRRIRSNCEIRKSMKISKRKHSPCKFRKIGIKANKPFTSEVFEVIILDRQMLSDEHVKITLEKLNEFNRNGLLYDPVSVELDSPDSVEVYPSPEELAVQIPFNPLNKENLDKSRYCQQITKGCGDKENTLKKVKILHIS
ncbi:hypothetical protein GJ496_003537 [Pomphorhynchus laevis]|nr:hypothetical protein GJ496_003537 [Pomphorhynchus laevis]